MHAISHSNLTFRVSGHTETFSQSLDRLSVLFKVRDYAHGMSTLSTNLCQSVLLKENTLPNEACLFGFRSYSRYGTVSITYACHFPLIFMSTFSAVLVLVKGIRSRSVTACMSFGHTRLSGCGIRATSHLFSHLSFLVTPRPCAHILVGSMFGSRYEFIPYEMHAISHSSSTTPILTKRKHDVGRRLPFHVVPRRLDRSPVSITFKVRRRSYPKCTPFPTHIYARSWRFPSWL